MSSSIEKAEGAKEQLDAELKAHRADRDSAKRSVADANALREKEAGAYAASSAELNSNIGAIGKTWSLPGAMGVPLNGAIKHLQNYVI